MLTNLHDDEFALALDGDLEEGVARHVLDARVRLVHEFEQLVHDSLQKLPVQAKEPGVLAHNVHDVRRNDSLVVLTPRDLAEVEEVTDRGDEEPVLLVLRHRARDGPDGPAQGVQDVPAILLAVELVRELVEHLRLRVLVVEVREVDESLPHDLVLHEHVVVLERLADDISVLVLDDQHLLGLRHAADHEHAKLRHGTRVEHPSVGPRAVRRAGGGEGKLRHPAAARGVTVALVQVAHQHVPVIQTNLENLGFVGVGDVQEVLESDEQVRLVLRGLLQEADVVLEILRQEYREVLDVRLLVVAAVGVRLGDLHAPRQNLLELLYDGDVELDKVRVVLLVHRQAANLAQALYGDVAELRIGR
mmetsp:Transcript_12755/g.49781  ORF Transcript_12755/g.49781 Transcript_12755/m.49781 type:complete len:361 (+) Transcript_12755:1515-2597(+)